MNTFPHIVIFGAGSIGCYLSGRLLAAGAQVTLIGRPRLQQALLAHGLTVTDYHGFRHHQPSDKLQYSTEVTAAAGADVVLLTVKSAATEAAGQSLALLLKPDTLVISLQNGLHNADRLRPLLRHCTVLPGMVGFNVIQRPPNQFHQGTEGHLIVEQHRALGPLCEVFQRAGFALETQADMHPVMCSKLLLNLNNAINALSNLPLKEELAQRAFRRCLALAQKETLALLKLAGIPTVRLTALPMPWLPYLMSTPDWLFKRLASKMLAIDPLARSSMWEDLEAGRPTEVNWLNGEVVRLAESLGRTAPVNAKLVSLVQAAEQGERRQWRGDELLQVLEHAALIEGEHRWRK